MVYRKEVNAQTVELEVDGNITEATVNEFRAAMYAELDRPHRQIRLNLQKVSGMNSASIGAILLFQKKAGEQGKEVVISQCSDDIRKILVAIHLDRLIAIEGGSSHTAYS